MPSALPVIVADANIFISYILNRGPSDRAIWLVSEWIMLGNCQLLLPEKLIVEISTCRSKPYLAKHLTDSQVLSFVSELKSVGKLVLLSESETNLYVRDKNDDYLMESAIGNGADFLITGDKDLLAIRDDFNSPRILTAPEFVKEFRLD